MNIVALTLRDVLIICGLLKNFPDSWNKSQIESGFGAGTLRVLGIKEGDKIFGVILYSLSVDTADIEDLFVAEEYRRNGAGRLLVAAAAEECKKAGRDKIFLEARKSNVAALNLYAKSGFKKISERKKYYGDEDAVVMVKEL